MEKEKLNVDIPRAISDFEAAAKEFELKEKIYKIIFRGKGLDFDRYRDYAPDEDATSIDWKASKRANKLIAKQYIEERELNILFVIDVSEDMLLGSGEKLKCEYAVEIFAALAHLIINSNDRVGVVLFNNKVKDYIPPKGGTNHFFMLCDKLSDPLIYGGGSKMDDMLRFLLDYIGKGIDAVIMLSDFIKIKESHNDAMFLVSNKFETFAIMVKDLLDKTLPDIDREIVIEDPSSGQQILINPKMIREIYETEVFEKDRLARDIFRRSNIDLLELTTDKPFSYSLAGFLAERAKNAREII